MLIFFLLAYWSLTPTVSYCIGALLLIIPLILILKLDDQLKKITSKEQ